MSRCRQQRIDDHLLKPVQQEELLESIYRVMSAAEAAPAVEDGIKRDNVPTTVEAGLRVLVAEDNDFNAQLLEQVLGRIIRKIAVKFAEGNTESVCVKRDDVPELLGPEAILPEESRKDLPAGVATGLAWTETGGDVLYIEAASLPQGKDVTITRQLGEVMQESAKTARRFSVMNAPPARPGG